MAVFNDTPRRGRMSIDDAMRSTDGALNILIVLLLIAFAFGSWYFYGRVTSAADHINSGASTITEPITSPPSPNANSAPTSSPINPKQ
jgi:hypothetical protein